MLILFIELPETGEQSRALLNQLSLLAAVAGNLLFSWSLLITSAVSLLCVALLYMSLRQISDHAGYVYFKTLRNTGWRSLAGVFLAFTGSEATFADIGHFGKNSVRASFLFVAYPCLMLT